MIVTQQVSAPYHQHPPGSLLQDSWEPQEIRPLNHLKCFYINRRALTFFLWRASFLCTNIAKKCYLLLETSHINHPPSRIYLDLESYSEMVFLLPGPSPEQTAHLLFLCCCFYTAVTRQQSSPDGPVGTVQCALIHPQGQSLPPQSFTPLSLGPQYRCAPHFDCYLLIKFLICELYLNY